MHINIFIYLPNIREDAEAWCQEDRLYVYVYVYTHILSTDKARNDVSVYALLKVNVE